MSSGENEILDACGENLISNVCGQIERKMKDLTFGTPRSPYPISGGTKRVLVSPLRNVHISTFIIHD